MAVNGKPECVYGTFLIGDDYAKGVLALYRSIRATKTNHPFIVFACDCSNNTIELLRDSGCRVFNIENLTPPTIIMKKNQIAGFERWNNTFSKLRILSFDQFKKIILLDSDMMVQNNIDHLFDEHHMSAVAAGKLTRPNWTDLNSGLMVIEPSKLEFQRALEMLQAISSDPSELVKYPKGIGDQDIIQALYPNWSEKVELHLPESYNLFQDCLTRYERLGLINPEDAHVIHFELNPKPWAYSAISYIQVLFRCIRFHSTAELKALRKYRSYLKD